MGISVGIKTKKEALRKLGKPYLMLLRAIILRLGKQKLVSYRDLCVRSVLRLQL
jgi:hypothetical protein